MPIRDYTGLGGHLAPIKAARHAGDDYGATADPDWRTIDWRAHLSQTVIRGRRINHVDIGQNRGGRAPVVFIHGLGGCWQNWLENLPRAAQDRRAIAMDLPGFGSSEMPAEEVTITNYARSVVELLDAVGIDGPVEVVGNSMGGFIAAEIGIRHADRCRRIALVSAAGISTTHVKKTPVLTSARVLAALTEFTILRARPAVKRPRLRHALLAYVARHPTRLRSDLAFQMMHGAGSPGFLAALGALLDYDFHDALPDIKCPTLLIWGREDNLVPVGDADEFERLIPNARKVILEDTGHVPMIERPQTYNDLLAEFLDEDPPSEAPDEVAEETGAAA
jgi:pimeloyl-ACP methyl ester carboxylesterase